jgi:predicted  nucleic acid-binding Zn-ribbon protein
MDSDSKDMAGALRSLDASITTVEDYQAHAGRELQEVHRKVDTLLERQSEILEFIRQTERRADWRTKTDERLQTIERQLTTHS